MGVITVETILGLTCPLTVLEICSDVDYSSSFTSYWIAQILYWDLPVGIYSLLTMLGVGINFMEGCLNSENE